MERCRDTARDGRGFIVPLDDDDVIELVKEHEKAPLSLEYPLLKKLFQQLIN